MIKYPSANALVERPQAPHAVEVEVKVIAADAETERGEAPNNDTIAVNYLCTPCISPRIITK